MNNYSNFGDSYNNVEKVEHKGPEVRANTIGNIDLSSKIIKQIDKDEIIKIIQDLKHNLSKLDLHLNDVEEAKSYLTIIESNLKKDNKEKVADNLNNLLTLTTNTGKILAEIPKIALALMPAINWLGELTGKYSIFSQILK